MLRLLCLPRLEDPASPGASVSLHRPCPCGPSRQGESCAEPPSSLASLPTSGPCRRAECLLNEWMRAAYYDGDDDEEEEVKGLRSKCQSLIQASGRINSFNLMTRLCVGVGGWGGGSCHWSHLGPGKFTLSVQGQLQPLATDWTALTQIHCPPVLESETCQGVGRAELPPEEGPSGLAQPLGDPRPPWACGHITPTSASICTILHPWVALCLRGPPPLFQGHPSLDLGSTCIPGDLVQRSVTSFHLPRPFIGIRPPLEAAEGWTAFGATTQSTTLVMRPQDRASLGLVQGASKKQGSVLGLPQENS